MTEGSGNSEWEDEENREGVEIEKSSQESKTVKKMYKKKHFIFLLMNSTWNFKFPKSLSVCVRERERDRERRRGRQRLHCDQDPVLGPLHYFWY